MGKIFRKVDYGNGSKYWYLFGKMIAKKIDNCFYLLKKQKDDEYTPDHWYVGWHDWKFDISYEECGYETGNAELNISIFGWHSVFKLPWKSKRFPDGDCDAPKWGIAIHNNTFWIYKGGDGNWGGGSKWWTWDLPFFTWEHIRHDVQCDFGNDDEGQDLRWVPYDELVHLDGKSVYTPLEENRLVNKYKYNYTDSYDGEVIPCTYWLEEREWRRKWFTWCNLKWFKKVDRYIEIVFEKEVGKRKGSWKGGCLGCGYTLKPGESPQECIQRMEKERKF